MANASLDGELDCTNGKPAATHSSSKPPIRVAHLIHTVAHGGVETALLNWASNINRDMVDLRLICFTNPDGSEKPFLKSAARAGFEVDQVCWNRSKPVFRAGRQTAELLRRHESNILHCHNTYGNATGLAAARLYPVKTITTLYVWGRFGFKRTALQWIDQVLMKQFDRVSAHCESCFRDTVERGIPESELDLLICGYPGRDSGLTRQERSARRSALGALPDDFVLVYLARFYPEKAHENLLASFRLILERHPRARLWLPGTGPALDSIKALSRQMGLDERVDFPGFQPDPDGLLAAADLQVHPSDDEGVALAICAGMNAGLPIIASRVGGLPEILRDGYSAVLIPPRSPEVLANEVCRLIDDPAEAARLGANARHFIRTDYSLDTATRKLEQVYRSMLGI